MSEDFRVLVQCVADYTGGMLTSLGATRVQVVPEESIGFATVIVSLQNNSWDTQAAALDRLADVRLNFLDDIALDFSFESPGVSDRPDVKTVELSAV